MFGLSQQNRVRRSSSTAEIDLDMPLLHLSPTDPFTTRMAAEGIFISGGIGSGKSSGSGAAFAKAFLRAGFGGLVCCAKPDERAIFEAYARETGRSGDLIILAEDQPWRFAFLDYEARRTDRGGGLTENILSLLSTVMELAEGKVGQSGDDFWERASKMMLRNAIELILMAQGKISLEAICRFIGDAPHSSEQVGNEDWQQGSFCAQIIRQAEQKAATDQERQGLETAGAFWLKSWAEMNERTRTSIEATFLSTSDLLLHGTAWKLFGQGTNLVPEVTFAGKVIILDLPIQQYHQVGVICQGLFKYVWQRAVLRRDIERYPLPVFLFMDEFQNLFSSFDREYQSVARSARACTIALTQNVDNLIAKLGGSQARHETHALLDNLVTKVFHSATGETAKYASEQISQSWMTVANYSAGHGGRGGHMNAGGSQSVQYKVLPSSFATLKKGGPANNHIVEGIVTQAGRIFRASNDTWMKCAFQQG